MFLGRGRFHGALGAAGTAVDNAPRSQPMVVFETTI